MFLDFARNLQAVLASLYCPQDRAGTEVRKHSRTAREMHFRVDIFVVPLGVKRRPLLARAGAFGTSCNPGENGEYWGTIYIDRQT